MSPRLVRRPVGNRFWLERPRFDWRNKMAAPAAGWSALALCRQISGAGMRLRVESGGSHRRQLAATLVAEPADKTRATRPHKKRETAMGAAAVCRRRSPVRRDLVRVCAAAAVEEAHNKGHCAAARKERVGVRWNGQGEGEVDCSTGGRAGAAANLGIGLGSDWTPLWRWLAAWLRRRAGRLNVERGRLEQAIARGPSSRADGGAKGG